MSHYPTRLHAKIQKTRTAALVGLDPRWDQLPEEIRRQAGNRGGNEWEIRAAGYEQFCLRVIDVVSGLVPAVKPQSAFFEECGPAGVQALANVMRAARAAGLIVICDAKRGDIGSTAQAYAAAYLAGEDPDSAPFAADALTINPYMGVDTLQPFVDRADRVGAGLYVLVRTSNPGAKDFQDRLTGEETLYRGVARHIETLAQERAQGGPYGLLGAVAGATYPAELAELRQAMPHVPFLVPGYGSQGGTSQDVAAAFDANGLGALINSSRGILFSFRKGPLAEEFGESCWEEAVEKATRLMIADLAAHTPVGKLAGC
jgi:orotidine-5'-phosphate decarboxylase